MSRPLLASVAFLIALASCSTSTTDESTSSAPDGSGGNGMASAATTRITHVSTTITSTSSSPISGSGVEVLENVEYHGSDDRFREGSGVVDIYRPDSGGGPWPVVVVFHGDPSFVDKSWSRPMAEELAARGRLVITPTWGRTSAQFRIDEPLGVQLDALVEELRCSLAVAFDLAAAHGGDTARLTVAGYSAGGNAALMAVLSDADPLEACDVKGPIPAPAALVAMEADVLLGASGWDGALEDDPEAFYSMTPWRDLSATDTFPVYIVAVEVTAGMYQRSIGADPQHSFLADRHIDIDLIAELQAMGVIDNGSFDMVDAQLWAVQAFEQAGYEVGWVLLTDSRHAAPGDPRWGMTDEAWEIAIETILTADGSG